MTERENLSAGTIRRILVLSFILCAVCITARAQSGKVFPFVDCVEHNRANNQTTVNFGYNNTNANTINTQYGATNFFDPPPAVRFQPTEFFAGVNHNAFSGTIDWSTQTDPLRWIVTGNSSPAIGANIYLPCTPAFTYQGKLSDNNANATGTYSFQFSLFSVETGGTALDTQTLNNVPVTNGVFTINLSFALDRYTQTNALFLEIAVRRGNETGAYTTLAPRQPLNPTPYSLHAAQSSTALNADRLGGYTLNQILNGNTSPTFIKNQTAEQASASFNIGGSGRIGGDLTIVGTLNAALPAGSANYIQNTTTQQANSNFNVSGSGTVGGTFTASTFTASNTNNIVFNGQSSWTAGTWLRLQNNSANGRNWNIISTGSGNGEGAGKLIFNDQTSGVTLLQIDSGGTTTVNGNLSVTGTISATVKNFKIDHPLDPQNKYLNYTSVESPDMMNIYNGNVTTDDNGEATVKLPDYFESLNRDFRYQLTVIGQFAQAIIAEKIKGNSFKIKTDKPNVEVSWQVTGIRHDKFAEDERIRVEENKPETERGKCFYAPACRIGKQ